MKNYKLLIMFALIFVCIPILTACTIPVIDTDDLLNKIEESANFDGTYLVEKYYIQNTQVEISESTPEALCTYVIDGAKFNIVKNEQIIESFDISACICGDLTFFDREDIHASVTKDGVLTMIRIYDDRTTKIIARIK